MNNTIFWGESAYENSDRLSIHYNGEIRIVSDDRVDMNGFPDEIDDDLTKFIGNDYAGLLAGRDEVFVLEEREDRTITRVGIREGSDYTVEGIGAGMDSEAIEQKLQEKGYSNTDVRMEDDRSIYWKIYENGEKGTFFAYRHAGNTCDAVYCGLKDYMPF